MYQSSASPSEALSVREVREALGLTLPDFARLAGFSARSLSGWERGGSPSGAGRRRMQEIRALQQALSAMARPESIGGWLLTPNEAFGARYHPAGDQCYEKLALGRRCRPR